MMKTNEELPYHYGTALLLRRKQLGITQEQLSQQTGISIRTISNIESGLPSVSIGTVNLLRQALGMTELE